MVRAARARRREVRGAAQSRGPWARAASARPFVGREETAAALADGVFRSGGYRERVLLVVGERGIGKTGLVAEVAARAEARGARAVWGRGWEGAVGQPLWPWRQAIDEIVSRLPRLAPHRLAVLDQLERVTGLAEGQGPAPAQPVAMFEAVAALLAAASVRAPLLVILDDLHLADACSLACLQFLSRDVSPARFLILGTCRDDEVSRRAPLLRALGGLDQRSRYVSLPPLERDDVGSYLQHTLGHELRTGLVDAVWARCGGNPFFLTKIAALYGDERGDAALPMPAGVREEVVGYRLAGLSGECCRLLRRAAVLGREFHVDVLERMAHFSGGEPDFAAARLATAVDEALGSGLIRERQDAPRRRCAFAYELVREALYQDLSLPERAALHRAAAAALVATGQPVSADELEDVAGHWVRAGSPEAGARAAECAAAAADRHAADGRYAAAARAYELAVAASEWCRGADAATGTRLGRWLVGLAQAYRRANEPSHAAAAIGRAADAARAIASDADPIATAEMLVEVAVERGAQRPWTRTGIGHDESIALLQNALRLLPEGDGELRVRALAQLAGEFWDSQSDSGSWRDATSREAVAMARRIGAGEPLARALLGRHWAAWFAETVHERQAAASEALSLGRVLADRELNARAHLLHALDLLETGSMIELTRALYFCSDLARQGGLDLLAWHADVVHASLAAFEGRLADAERLAQAAAERGSAIRAADAALFAGVQLYTLRRLQGRFEELLSLARVFVDDAPTLPVWRVGIADLHAQMGRDADARAAFEYFAAADFREPPRDWNWLLAMALLSEVCAFLDDRARAAVLYDRLLPFAHQNITAVPGLACIGSAAYPLGLLATTLGRWAEAGAHFELAITRNRHMGGAPYVAHAQRQYAAALIRQHELSGGDPDLGRAAQLLAAASRTYAQLGMDVYCERTRAVERRLADAQRSSAAAAVPVANAVRFERGRWVIAWQGRQAELPNLVGLRYIAYLIRCAPQPVHIAALEAACRGRGAPQDWGPAPAANRLRAEGLGIRRGLAPTAAVDGRARAHYRHRLDELAAELAEAEANHDLGRIATLKRERDLLVRELKSAFRPIGPDEKQRKRVARNINETALRALSRVLPALAEHLAGPPRTLYTGTFCRYAPAVRVAWDLTALCSTAAPEVAPRPQK